LSYVIHVNSNHKDGAPHISLLLCFRDAHGSCVWTLISKCLIPLQPLTSHTSCYWNLDYHGDFTYCFSRVSQRDASMPPDKGPKEIFQSQLIYAIHTGKTGQQTNEHPPTKNLSLTFFCLSFFTLFSFFFSLLFFLSFSSY
jgi:hypothetical protein